MFILLNPLFPPDKMYSLPTSGLYPFLEMSELIVYTKLCSDAEEKSSFSSCFEAEYAILDNPEALSSLSTWHNPVSLYQGLQLSSEVSRILLEACDSLRVTAMRDGDQAIQSPVLICSAIEALRHC